MTAWRSVSLDFAADHPAAAGHFPGNPIIPGALLLDGVVAAIAGDRAVTIRAAKFLQIVRPGETLTLRWQSPDASAVKFEATSAAGDLAVSGTLEIGPAL